MHFWNPRWCSLDPELGVLEWRKLQDDAAPNGYVDITAAKVVDIGDNEDGLVVDGKTHCFLVVDSTSVEHFFCAETTRAFALWLPVLRRYLRVGNRSALATGTEDVHANGDSSGPGEAPEKSADASAASTVRVDVVTDSDAEPRGSELSSLQQSPASMPSLTHEDTVAVSASAGRRCC